LVHHNILHSILSMPLQPVHIRNRPPLLLLNCCQPPLLDLHETLLLPAALGSNSHEFALPLLLPHSLLILLLSPRLHVRSVASTLLHVIAGGIRTARTKRVHLHTSA
jgi:hypothetical protein